MQYNLELDKVIKEIRRQKAKVVCIQLPDGLKPIAKHIVDKIELETNSKIIMWQGSCFGACDLPLQLENLGIDLVVQFGHNEYERKLS